MGSKGMKILGTWCFLLLWSEAHADLFSAVSGMEALLKTEGALLESLHTYLQHQEGRLQLLKKRYEGYLEEYNMAQKDVTNYLSNPINAFKLIRKIHLGWKMTEQNILDDGKSDYAKITNVLKNASALPDSEDMSGAVDGLIRLQDLYHLDAAELSEGVLNGAKESSPMSVNDCLEIGIRVFKLEKYSHAVEWLSVALSKYEKESNEAIGTKIKILDYLVYSHFKIGDIINAKYLSHDLLRLKPNDPRFTKNLRHYEKLLKSDTGKQILLHKNVTKYVKNYEELCRDEMDIPEYIKKDLKCRYWSETSSFLRLAPVKLEEYYLDPYIVVFHDIIYDDEIKYIKETAIPRIQRATIISDKDPSGLVSKTRVSKSGWIKDDEHEIMQRINRRVSDVTGLSLQFAEIMQVANYGIGGYYQPHMDFSKKENKNGFKLDNNNPNGNRIATFMFYLSDVAQGGRTVFPEIGVGATPRKGSAIFWINLHPSGEGDAATLHSACPVLQGDKWVANKWIRQRGQELRRLCDLEYTDEGLKKKYPKPISKINLTKKFSKKNSIKIPE